VLVVCDILVNHFCPARTNEPLISLAYFRIKHSFWPTQGVSWLAGGATPFTSGAELGPTAQASFASSSKFTFPR